MKCRPQANQGLADEEGIKRSKFPHVTVTNANPIFLPALFNRFLLSPAGNSPSKETASTEKILNFHRKYYFC